MRAHPTNPRYFTDGASLPDGSLKAVYLTGSHTWNNLVDMLREGGSPRFDFGGYLNFLERHNHNFVRLWAWDSFVYNTRANGRDGQEFVHTVSPLPWSRTGEGLALDGRPKFDLAKFDPEYFERLRNRVNTAQQRGIYVSVMLFEGWGLMHGSRNRGTGITGWAWRAHPFHPDNNVNGVVPALSADGIGRIHSLGNPRMNELQAAYIRRVVDTVNEFNNVLYEVINEGGEAEWDWWVLNTIADHQRTKPKRHLIGITGHGAENLQSMLASRADWISPGSKDISREDPPVWPGKKISIFDTDHLWGVGGNAAWVWKSFLRGHHPIFMDPYERAVLGRAAEAARWDSIRRAMGDTLRFAERLNLAAMNPRPDVASSGYCLADEGKTYLAYQPDPGREIEMTLPPGTYGGEWFDPQTGKTEPVEPVTVAPNSRRPRPSFRAPFDGVAVLLLQAETKTAP